MTAVSSSMAAAMADGSTRVVTGSTGTTVSPIPNRCAALAKAGWAVSGLTMVGRFTPRASAASR